MKLKVAVSKNLKPLKSLLRLRLNRPEIRKERRDRKAPRDIRETRETGNKVRPDILERRETGKQLSKMPGDTGERTKKQDIKKRADKQERLEGPVTAEKTGDIGQRYRTESQESSRDTMRD